SAHDRHPIQLQIFDDRRDLGGLDLAQARQDLRYRAGAHAHGLRQASLALSCSFQSSLYHSSVQHGITPSPFRSPIYVSDYRNTSLTFRSEYRKWMESRDGQEGKWKYA